MAWMTSASTPARTGFAALLALLLAVRLLSPAGFMPVFDHGAVTIVACPDAGAAPMLAHHDHPTDQRQLHQHCPYAAASSLGALPGDWVGAVAPTMPGAALLLLAPAPRIVERDDSNQRPPPTGPPLRS